MSKAIEGDLVSDEELCIKEGFKCLHCGKPFPVDIDRLATLIAYKILDTPITPNPLGVFRKAMSSMDMRNKVIVKTTKIEDD